MDSYYSSDEEVAWGPLTLREIQDELQKSPRRITYRQSDFGFCNNYSLKERSIQQKKCVEIDNRSNNSYISVYKSSHSESPVNKFAVLSKQQQLKEVCEENNDDVDIFPKVLHSDCANYRHVRSSSYVSSNKENTVNSLTEVSIEIDNNNSNIIIATDDSSDEEITNIFQQKLTTREQPSISLLKPEISQANVKTCFMDTYYEPLDEMHQTEKKNALPKKKKPCLVEHENGFQQNNEENNLQQQIPKDIKENSNFERYENEEQQHSEGRFEREPEESKPESETTITKTETASEENDFVGSDKLNFSGIAYITDNEEVATNFEETNDEAVKSEVKGANKCNLNQRIVNYSQLPLLFPKPEIKKIKKTPVKKFSYIQSPVGDYIKKKSKNSDFILPLKPMKGRLLSMQNSPSVQTLTKFSKALVSPVAMSIRKSTQTSSKNNIPMKTVPKVIKPLATNKVTRNNTGNTCSGLIKPSKQTEKENVLSRDVDKVIDEPIFTQHQKQMKEKKLNDYFVNKKLFEEASTKTSIDYN